MTWPRFVVTAVLACVGVAAWAVYDLTRTLERAVRLPDQGD